MTSKAWILFQPSGRRVHADYGVTILECAREAGTLIESVCGGRGECGKCKVIVSRTTEGLSGITEAERSHFTPREIEEGCRLACQARIVGDAVVNVPVESVAVEHKIVTGGIEEVIALEPLVEVIHISVPPPDITDQRSDLTRLIDKLRDQIGKALKCDLGVLRTLSETLRRSDWEASVVVWDDEIVDVRPAKDEKLFGIALDIGTTSIAGYLVDLKNGKTVAVSARPNPQIMYGDDVISRIDYADQHEDGLEKLKSAVVDGVNKIIEDLCTSAGIENTDVSDMVVVGNTAMHHFFLGLDLKHVALSPFVPVTQDLISVKAKEIRIDINPNSYVSYLPLIAGFVGADVIGDVLASGIYESEKLSLLIDIGTNGEIVLGNTNGLVACSCAAGPAFEGAHIKHGMRAAPGAVEKVTVDPKTGEVSYKTVGDTKPVGICGSGLVDAVANLLQAGIISPSGRFNLTMENPRLRGTPPEFVIAWAGETSTNNDIVITQKDIRELQLAKSAIYTGAAILMKRMGVSTQDVDGIYLSGAFGNYVNPNSALAIGLLPDIDPRKIYSIGHGAGLGAKFALKSKVLREKTRDIARRIRYVELCADPNFKEEFINAGYFPNRDLSRFPNVRRKLNI